MSHSFSDDEDYDDDDEKHVKKPKTSKQHARKEVEKAQAVSCDNK